MITAVVSGDHLGAAPTHVDEGGFLRLQIHAAGNAEVNEPGFLFAGNHPHVQAGILPEAAQKITLVFGLANRGGGHRDDFLRPVGTGEFGKLAADEGRTVHGLRLENLIHKFPFPKTNDLFLPGQSCVGMVGVDAYQEEPYRVGAYIQKTHQSAV
jgi:hypothetical protein